MKIVYRPENGPEQSWDYEPGRMQSAEAEAIERVTGWTWQEFGEKFMAGSIMAQHALLWVFLRRENRSLKYGDVKFAMNEFDVTFDDTEIAAMREALDKGDLTDEERDLLAAYIEAASVASDASEQDADPTSPAE